MDEESIDSDFSVPRGGKKQGFLASKLKDYYKRRGNRIVFSNNLTLSRLSLEIWERLDFRNFDVSTFSRVLKGERLFTPYQLRAFCCVLGLCEEESDSLERALQKDVLAKSGFSL